MFEKIIKIPYTTNPHMEKYEGPIIVQPALEFSLGEKQSEYDLMQNLIYFESNLAIEKQLLKKLTEKLKLEKECNTIISLGLNIQEDVVILHDGKIEAAFVAFPSGWSLDDKQGKTLEEIHEPVADGEILRQMSNKLTHLLCGKYSYHRYVWTLSPTGMFSMHPYYLYDEPVTLDDIWFRLEHQTTLPIIEGESSAFFINVDVLPYNSLHDKDKNLIVESINSMTDAVLNYKHLRKIKDILNMN